jgi:hypothetical protein
LEIESNDSVAEAIDSFVDAFDKSSQENKIKMPAQDAQAKFPHKLVNLLQKVHKYGKQVHKSATTAPYLVPVEQTNRL